jgi:O-antigen/teichoic acid export membrane protein
MKTINELKNISLKNMGRYLPDGSLRSRFTRGSFWSVIGAIVSSGLGLLSSIVIARILLAEGFGKLGVIQNTVTMFQVFATFGLGITATKYVAEFRKKDPIKTKRIIILIYLIATITGIITTIILLAFAQWISTNILASPNIASLLRICSIMLVLGSINGIQIGTLVGFEAFKSIAKVNLYSGIVKFLAMVIGVFAGGLEGAVWGMTISLLFTCYICQLAMNKETAGIPKINNTVDCLVELKIIWLFSIPALLGAFMAGPIMWLSNAIIVNQPGGYIAMGIFNAANQWQTAILFLPNTIGAIVLPMLSNLEGSKDRGGYNNVLKFSMLINGGLALFGALFIIIFSNQLLAIYGKEFGSGQIVLIYLAITAVFCSIAAVIGGSIASQGKMWWGFVLNFLWACVFISITWTFRTRGAIGLASAYLIAYFFHLITTGIFAYYFLIKKRRTPIITLNLRKVRWKKSNSEY